MIEPLNTTTRHDYINQMGTYKNYNWGYPNLKALNIYLYPDYLTYSTFQEKLEYSAVMMRRKMRMNQKTPVYSALNVIQPLILSLPH